MTQYKWRKEHVKLDGTWYKLWVFIKLLGLYAFSGIAPMLILVLAGLYQESRVFNAKQQTIQQQSHKVFTLPSIGHIQYAYQCTGGKHDDDDDDGKRLNALYLHGVYGGYEEGQHFAAIPQNHELCVIYVSRVNYVQSNITSPDYHFDESPLQLIEYTSQLLNGLIDEVFGSEAKVHLSCSSGGGPYAIHFVTHFSHRVQSLGLIGAIVREFNDVDLVGYGREYKNDNKLVNDNEVVPLTPVHNDRHHQWARMVPPGVFDFLAYLMYRISTFNPALVARIVLENAIPSETPDQKRDFEQCIQFVSEKQPEIIQSLVASRVYRYSQRRVAKDKDMIVYMALDKNQTDVLKNIKVPTLILHSSIDRTVDFRTNALYAHQRIPNSSLFVAKGCGHYFQVLGSESQRVQNELLQFMITNNN